ncbi:hypothetical protein [Flavobacterium phragmitis]|uniref:Uncharacterized protein n=1 Tax=Flavobacterium phragmitis TaxID=739143 RepID=A0A1I1SUP3_9FLAO|nr:hypothetical protein [Flavobacterium phragmitis]SFD50185.1 hypothetical protein SAMN05216297_108223 [Flavobacterium phragmitis]
MKTHKIRSKEITKEYLSNKSKKNKDKAINVMVFGIVFFVAVLLLSKIIY